VTLSRAPDELTILDIVQAVDAIKRLEQCPLGLPAHLELCPLHSELDEAMSVIEGVLSRRTIAELLASQAHSDSTKRCDFPRDDQSQLYQL